MTALSLSCIWGKTVAIKDMQTLRDEGRVATNLTGAELLLCEQSGLSKVLTLDTIHDWLESKCGCAGGGAGNLCHFGRIGSELGMTEPEPTFAEPEDWEAGRIRWNSAGTALLVDVYGHAAHFDQLDVIIRIYACKAGADVLTQNPDGSRILLYSYAVPESAVLSSSGGLVGTGTAISGFACNEIAHTKEPNSEYGFINFSSIEDAATCCWHGTAEIPAEHLSAFNSNFPDDNHLQILAAVIYADQVPIQNPENGLFTHGGILCGSMVLEIPENTAGVISCAGAISSAEFNFFSKNAPYVVELDGEVVETSGQPFGYGSAPELQALFEVNNDGFYKVRNLDSVEHRVKLTPETYNPAFPTVIDTTPFMSAEPNSTITIDPDTGVITFCLAAGA